MNKYIQAQQIKLVHSGNNYFELLEQLIENSRETVHLQTYIFDADATGMRIIEALKKAAKRNVKVYVLADAFGSNSFPGDLIKELNDLGVHFRLFSPLFSSESIYFGRRLHHKIAVADKKTGLVGGINIADKYYGVKATTSAWLDYAVLVNGPVCEYLHLLCEQFYFRRRINRMNRWERTIQASPLNNPKLVRFRRNDWIKGQNEIRKSYIDAVGGAKKSILIVASYFLPGTRFRRLLKRAAARGMDVKVIMAGKSDINSVRLAESYLYDFYLRNKIQIYEWHNSVMHGKAMIVDNKWATVGSYNINYLSHYISIELNAEIIDPEFLNEFAIHLDEIINKHCEKIVPDKTMRKINWYKQFRMWLAYIFYKLIKDMIVPGKNHRD